MQQRPSVDPSDVVSSVIFSLVAHELDDDSPPGFDNEPAFGLDNEPPSGFDNEPTDVSHKSDVDVSHKSGIASNTLAAATAPQGGSAAPQGASGFAMAATPKWRRCLSIESTPSYMFQWGRVGLHKGIPPCASLE